MMNELSQQQKLTEVSRHQSLYSCYSGNDSPTVDAFFSGSTKEVFKVVRVSVLLVGNNIKHHLKILTTDGS